ncbi:MAG: DNA cytosine methyltransferase [Patescibacteria group bacterium]|nr:DNA cytosine methyltransferase [Patescibacteria group bacterium]
MKKKPRLLDLFCGAGGAGMGYSRAGFEVVGVDIKPQPNYPFEFHQADAMTFPLDGFDFVHASPPCQRYSIANNIHGRSDHPDLVDPIRDRLIASGIPYVIENVPGAPLLNPVVICGRALLLNVKRHRLFESSKPILGTCCPKGHAGDWVSVFGHTVLSRGKVIGKAKGGGNTIKRTHLGTEVGRVAMGIHWMNRDELSEAIPPAYTEYLGRQLIAQLSK